MIRAEERWLECMTSAGYRFESGDEVMGVGLGGDDDDRQVR